MDLNWKGNGSLSTFQASLLTKQLIDAGMKAAKLVRSPINAATIQDYDQTRALDFPNTNSIEN